MTRRAFVIANDRAAAIANDVHDFRYRARMHCLPAGAQTAPLRNDLAETQVMVEDGVFEIMIGGAAGYVFAGDFVRVPPGVAYACRNAGETIGVLLVRTVSPGVPQRALRLVTGAAA